MNALAILELSAEAATLIPQVVSAWNGASGNSLSKVTTLLKSSASSGLLSQLEQLGAAAFPSLDPAFHAASAMLTVALKNTGILSWVQEGLNEAQKLGFIQFAGTGPAGGNTPLIVDGKYGPRTQAAMNAFQAKLGLPTTGFFEDIEVAVLTAITSGNGIGAILQRLLGAIKL